MMCGSKRIYRLLLSLYSRALRVEYGDDMIADFSRMMIGGRAAGQLISSMNGSPTS